MVLFYASKRKREIAAATLCAIASALMSVMLLSFLNSLARNEVDSPLVTLKLGFACVFAVFFTNALSQRFLAELSASIISDLRLDLSKRFMVLEYEKLLANRSLVGDALIVHIAHIAPLLLTLPQITFSVLMVLFCFIYLGHISIKLLVVFAVLAGLGAAATMVMLRKTHQAFNALHGQSMELYQLFHAISHGKKELTFSHARATHFADVVLRNAIDRTRRTLETAHRWGGYGESVSTTMLFAAIFAVIYSGTAVFEETPYTILQFVMVALFVMGPLTFVVNSMGTVSMGVASVRHLQAIGITVGVLGVTSSAEGKVSAEQRWPEPWKTITAIDLRYRYPGDEKESFSFGPVCLSIRRGETVFVVGGNGSGKSTFALLISGLLSPSAGHIEVDGVPVDANNREQYQALFTGVFADFHLFTDVVARKGGVADDAQVAEWLRRFDLAEKVVIEGGKLSTVAVSTGQRKRLALIQACMDESEIYVLDEWAADQDQTFRNYYYLEFLPELKKRGKTVIAITHDERFFNLADRVLGFELGKLAPACVGSSDAPMLVQRSGVTSAFRPEDLPRAE